MISLTIRSAISRFAPTSSSDLRLHHQRAGCVRIGNDHRCIEVVRGSTRHLRDIPDQVNRALVDVRAREHPAQLHHRAGRHLAQNRAHRQERPRPRESEHIVALDDLLEQARGDTTQVRPQNRLIFLGRVDDETPAHAELRGQLDRKREVDVTVVMQLDPNKAAAASTVEGARDLESAQAQLLGDVALTDPVDVVTAGDLRRKHGLSGSGDRCSRGCHQR